MEQLEKWLNQILEVICVIFFIFITIIGTYQIVTRYVFNSPSTVSEELLTYSFTWLAVLSAALVFGKREHMRMGFLADKMTGMLAKVVNIIIELLVLLFAAGVMVYGGISITKLTTTQVTASLGIPMAYIYVVIPISGVLIIIYCILNIIKIINGDDLDPDNVDGQGILDENATEFRATETGLNKITDKNDVYLDK